MKLMEIYKSLTEDLNINSYTDLYRLSPETLVDNLGKYSTGDPERDEAVEVIRTRLNQDFPKGFKNIPDVILLYRFLLINDGVKIDETKIGIHFVADKSIIDDDWLYDIGVRDVNENSIGYILTCRINRDSIDFKNTIKNNIFYWSECEFTLYGNSNVVIINKEKYQL